MALVCFLMDGPCFEQSVLHFILQHLMLVPTEFPSFGKAIIAIRDIYRVHLKASIIQKFGQDASKEDDAGGYNLDISVYIGMEFCGSESYDRVLKRKIIYLF
ncbi:hypothetical protein PanWU01x14_347080 [Parasponia andersonii]|uniref:Enolase C-terminal TIM barrel domain-containing protein n=1 Tax=Parasponia andersonii TaxID=3476 RepID=A0A2P5AC60_PARAD|nr:hypothetical protein PanWU01x14_347080 [Parasponia andersonii]